MASQSYHINRTVNKWFMSLLFLYRDIRQPALFIRNLKGRGINHLFRKCGGLSGIIQDDLNSGKGANKSVNLRA